MTASPADAATATAGDASLGRGQYTIIAMALHWAIAAAIVTNLALGWRMHAAVGVTQLTLLQLHKSVGVVPSTFRPE